MRVLLTVLIAAFFGQMAQAQQGSVEISAKYGLGSVQEIGESLGTALGQGFVQAITGKTVTDSEFNASGAITGAIEYYVSDNISLGAAYTYEKFDYSYTLNDMTTYDTERVYSIPMGSVTVRYINNESFQLYGNGAVGGYFSKETSAGATDEDKQSDLAFQITPIGARFGNNFGVKIELGIGFQGLAMGGVSGKF